jgi:excisionase family DNA binding protein
MTTADCRFFTVTEVASRYRVKPRTVRDWIKRGRIVAMRTGRLIRISSDALAAFEKNH